MVAMLSAFDRLVARVALGVAMALLALMSVITFWQVITRFLLEEPSTWSEVTARSLMIWMVYLGLAVALRTGSLIAVDLLMEKLPATLRKVLAVGLAAITLGVLGVMIWYGWLMAERTATQSIAGLVNPFTGNTISIGLVYAAIPVGAALSVVAVIARLAEDLARGVAVHAGPATHDV